MKRQNDIMNRDYNDKRKDRMCLMKRQNVLNEKTE